MCFTATMLMGKKMKTFRGGAIGCWRSKGSCCYLCNIATHIATTSFGLIIIFCRDFMHIVLVHYLEVKVIPNPTLIDIYLAACPLWLLDFIILNAVFLKKLC